MVLRDFIAYSDPMRCPDVRGVAHTSVFRFGSATNGRAQSDAKVRSISLVSSQMGNAGYLANNPGDKRYAR